MRERAWFKARESGLGWTPITWEGWLITIGSAALVVAVNVVVVAHLGALRPKG